MKSLLLQALISGTTGVILAAFGIVVGKDNRFWVVLIPICIISNIISNKLYSKDV